MTTPADFNPPSCKKCGKSLLVLKYDPSKKSYYVRCWDCHRWLWIPENTTQETA